VDCSSPGYSRRGRGRGFEYRDEDGAPIRDSEDLERLRALSIPPAWKDVWICPDPMGHLQATGVDAAGRKQYLYHERWRTRRDREKFDRMLEFAAGLPALRRRVNSDLGLRGLGRDRVLACAVRLLDRGFFRTGGETYAEENGTFGLATLRRRHATVGSGYLVRFEYPAKGGAERVQAIIDPDVHEVVSALKRVRNGGPDLLRFKENGSWRDVRSADVNDYIREAAGDGFSAKDFRTWHATVLAAVSLAVYGQRATSKTARKRIASLAVDDVAHYLGNTPAVCRSSYIDPRIVDRFDAGITVRDTLEALNHDVTAPEARERVEGAVVAILDPGRE
jgi:DNA topoisomerase IB